MDTTIRELAAGALKTAKAAGANACSVAVSGTRNVEIDYRGGKPETIKEASTRDIQVDLFVKGRWSAQGTSDLRPDAVKSFITDAVKTTKLLAEDTFRSLPDPELYTGQAKKDLGQVDPKHANLKPEDRHAWAKAIEAGCLEQGGDKIISAITKVADSRQQSLLMTSNGFEGAAEDTSYLAYVRVTAQDVGDRRPNGYTYVVAVSRDELPKAEAIGAEAADRTLALLGGKKIKTETLPVVIENRNVGRVLGALLQAMSGRAVQQKQSFLADKKGVKIASEVLTLVDDPFIVGGLGSRLFDREGIAAKKRTMIEKGVLKDFYINWYYSRKLDCAPTTGGSSNLVIPPGKRSVATIMKDLKRGILITDFIGGNSNSTTGDMSVGVVGQLFDDGEVVHPVSEMNIAGNALEFWHKLAEAADDPWPYSSLRMPSLVFTDIVVAGI